MIRSAALVIGVAVMAGCASSLPQPPRLAAPQSTVVTEPVPTCSGKQQCEAMWISAYEQLQNITGMRMQTTTDSVLQTFGPVRGAQLSGMATKFPVGTDRYEIRVRFTCGRTVLLSGCDDLRASATNVFNAMVTP